MTRHRRRHDSSEPDEIGTGEIRTETTGTNGDGSGAPETDDGTADGTGTPDRRSWRDRNWKYLYHTRIRTSTTILMFAFIVCWVLYGYTSQRYLPPVQPTNSNQVVRTTTPTYTEPLTTYSSTHPSTSTSVSGESSGPTGSGGSNPSSGPGAGQTGSSESPSSTTGGGFQLPFLAPTTTTTTVPSR